MPSIDPNKPTEKLEGFTLHCDKGQDLAAQPDAHQVSTKMNPKLLPASPFPTTGIPMLSLTGSTLTDGFAEV